MGKITDISRQKRNKTRVSVFIDGEFVCGLDAVAAASARIKIGDEITPDELKSLMAKSESNSAFERAVAYLSTAPRAEKEIRRYLHDKGYTDDIVNKTVDKLNSYHYIDDMLYAQTYIKSKAKKYGNFRIASELRQKGVAREIIDELLDDNDEDGIDGIAERYLASHGNHDRQKLKRFLAGRGFSWESISAAISRLDESGAFSTSEIEYEY